MDIDAAAKPRGRIARLLTTDFCPSANRYVYWLKTPLGVLIASAAVALLCGFFVAPQGFVLAAAIACVIGLGIVWPWVALKAVDCELRFPTKRTNEGESVTVTVALTNRWPFPVWGLGIERGFFDVHQSDDQAEGETLFALSCVRGWSRSDFRWQFTPARRGHYPVEAPALVTEFPFGLWKATRPITIREKITVWPTHVPLDQISLPSGESRTIATPSEQVAGTEGEVLGVRPFRTGDSLRQVNWTQTARCDRLIVSERQGYAQSRVILELATDRQLYSDPDTFEDAIRITASVIRSLVSQSVYVTLIAGPQRTEVVNRPSSIRGMMDILAGIEFSASRELSQLVPSRNELHIRITTEKDARPNRHTGRKIVLIEETPPEEAQSVNRFTSSIELNSNKNVLTQLQKKWRRNTGASSVPRKRLVPPKSSVDSEVRRTKLRTAG